VRRHRGIRGKGKPGPKGNNEKNGKTKEEEKERKNRKKKKTKTEKRKRRQSKKSGNRKKEKFFAGVIFKRFPGPSETKTAGAHAGVGVPSSGFPTRPRPPADGNEVTR
jgi:epoxyqueuosine reductase QueG